jgi:phosphatidylglycerol:prolipoprotein diacylglycerol transferase
VIPEIGPIKTFGLMFGLAFIASGLIVSRRLKEQGRSADWGYEIVFAALLGGVIGARLWWLLEDTGRLTDNLLGNVFGGAGLTWYGGALGGALSVCIWARRRGILGLGLLDMCAPALAVGYAVGRIGCQLSGDGDYGKPWDGPWAMAYPDGVVPTDVPVHPTPIYETLAMGFAGLLLWRLRDRLAPGRLFALYLVLAGAERLLVEFVRRNEPVALGLTAAQWISIAMLVAGATWLALTRANANAPTRSSRA